MSQFRIVEYRGVMVVGKTGAGKSTVSNAVVRSDDRFTVSGSASSCTSECKHCDVEVTEGNTFYKMKVMDTVGLFDTGPTTNDETIIALKKYVQEHFVDGMNLIIFVLREGRFTPEEKKSFDFIRNKFGENVSAMSALVITNCDNKDEKGRSEVVEEFKTNALTKPTAEFMKSGIYAVGFPPKKDYTSLPYSVKAYYEQSITKDQEKLWGLVKQSSKARLNKELYKSSFWDRCTIL